MLLFFCVAVTEPIMSIICLFCCDFSSAVFFFSSFFSSFSLNHLARIFVCLSVPVYICLSVSLSHFSVYCCLVWFLSLSLPMSFSLFAAPPLSPPLLILLLKSECLTFGLSFVGLIRVPKALCFWVAALPLWWRLVLRTFCWAGRGDKFVLVAWYFIFLCCWFFILLSSYSFIFALAKFKYRNTRVSSSSSSSSSSSTSSFSIIAAACRWCCCSCPSHSTF